MEAGEDVAEAARREVTILIIVIVIIVVITIIIIITSPWPAFGWQGLVGSSGKYTFDR